MSNTGDVECLVCPKTFATEHSMQIHRGHVHGPNTETCDVCGDEYECTPSAAKRGNANLCSPECEREYRGFGAPVEFECDWCGTPGTEEAAEYARWDHHFCDTECRRNWVSKEFSGENAYWYHAGDSFDADCTTCGATVRVHAPNTNDNHFCCRECYSKWLSTHQVGENNPAYVDGNRSYGTGWNEAKKEAVRERDERKCQHCGLSEAEHITQRGRRLDVHHIVPARLFDDDHARNAMDNLEALCAPCHRKAERIAPLRPDAPAHN